MAVNTSANDYNYWSNELKYHHDQFPIRDYSCPMIHAAPAIRLSVTLLPSMLAFVFEGVDLNQSSGGPSALSIAFTSITAAACAINVFLSCCFCRNIQDKERTYLLAKDERIVSVIRTAKSWEGVGLIFYPALATIHISLLIYLSVRG